MNPENPEIEKNFAYDVMEQPCLALGRPSTSRTPVKHFSSLSFASTTSWLRSVWADDYVDRIIKPNKPAISVGDLKKGDVYGYTGDIRIPDVDVDGEIYKAGERGNSRNTIIAEIHGTEFFPSERKVLLERIDSPEIWDSLICNRMIKENDVGHETERLIREENLSSKSRENLLDNLRMMRERKKMRYYKVNGVRRGSIIERIKQIFTKIDIEAEITFSYWDEICGWKCEEPYLMSLSEFPEDERSKAKAGAIFVLTEDGLYFTDSKPKYCFQEENQ